MRAIVQDGYGPSDRVLRLAEIDRPEPGDDEVLIRVRATSVHPDVWHVVTGRPYLLRLMGAGLRRPKQPVPGTDMAGEVEAVGRKVTRFKPGDRVFGETFRELQWNNGGSFAEYATAPQDILAPIPEGVSFEQAAAVPTPGFIVMLNLQGGSLVRPGGEVLVNGAAGNVGGLAVQVAKSLGARVTGVDGPDRLDLVMALGADRTIDYTEEDFTTTGERYDLVFDVASTLKLSAARRCLNPGGKYILIGHDHFGGAVGPVLGSVPRVLGLTVLSRFIKELPRPDFSSPEKGPVMARLAELMGEGKISPIIDSVRTLEDVPEAMRIMEQGRARGRLIITP